MTAFIGSPLPYPLFSIVNTLIGVFIFFLVAGLGVFYTNTWWVQYLPIASVSQSPSWFPSLSTSRRSLIHVTDSDTLFRQHGCGIQRDKDPDTREDTRCRRLQAVLAPLPGDLLLPHLRRLLRRPVIRHRAHGHLPRPRDRRALEAGTEPGRRRPSQDDAQVQGHAELVVLCTVCCLVRPVSRHCPGLGHPSDVVGADRRVPALHCLPRPHRHDPGHHKHAARAQRADRVHGWLHASGTAHCHDALQDLWLHHDGSSSVFHSGYEVWSLPQGSGESNRSLHFRSSSNY